MLFKTNPEKKAFFKEIRAKEKELRRAKRNLRKQIKLFMNERDPEKAKKQDTLCAILALDIVKKTFEVDEMIDRYNEM